MKARTLAVALAVASSIALGQTIEPNAGDKGPPVGYYLLPAPWTKICEPYERLTFDWYTPGEIHFVCHGGHKYVGLILSSDCAPFYIETQVGGWSDGWYRITCHVVI